MVVDATVVVASVDVYTAVVARVILTTTTAIRVVQTKCGCSFK